MTCLETRLQHNAAFIVALCVLAVFSLSGCRNLPDDPPSTVSTVHLDRYLGQWYEIASFPAWFQEGCVGSTAEYRLRKDGDIDVINRCRDGSLTGKERSAEGIARLDPSKPDGSRLLVSFVPLIEGWYWILALDNDYHWSLVGTPDRRRLWILSRTPTLQPAVFDAVVAKAAALGFDVLQLQKTLQQSPPQNP
ncbi:Outer membrane lipoprotein Blc [Azospirillaceae bacterium]